MQTIIKHFNSSVANITPLATTYLGESKAQAQLDKLNKEINRERLNIMVFGAYNAGKSSLINALRGSNDAHIGEIPTTDTVDSYEWGTCYLLDSPGVNAPIEHENVSQEKLEASLLVLMVIREGDQDAADVYERLFAMLEQNKKVFIVFNHQLKAEDLNTALQKLNSILEVYRQKTGIPKQQIETIRVFPVNVKTALTANEQTNEEHAEKLAIHSGIVEFKQAFNDWYIQYDNDESHLNSIKNIASRCLIEPIWDVLSHKISDTGELQDTRRELSTLERKKAEINSKINSLIGNEAPSLSSNIEEIIRRTNGQNCEGEIQNQAQKILDSANQLLQSELDSKELNLMANQDLANELNLPTGEAVRVVNSEISPETQALIAKGAAIILGTLGSVGKILGRATVLIPIVIEAFNAYQASQREQAENQARLEAERRMRQAIDNVVTSVLGNIKEQAKQTIDLVFNPEIKRIENLIKDLKNQANQAEKDRDLLDETKSDIDNLAI